MISLVGFMLSSLNFSQLSSLKFLRLSSLDTVVVIELDVETYQVLSFHYAYRVTKDCYRVKWIFRVSLSNICVPSLLLLWLSSLSLRLGVIKFHYVIKLSLSSLVSFLSSLVISCQVQNIFSKLWNNFCWTELVSWTFTPS